MAATDALSGLSNRRHFNESLAREWQRAMRANEPLALLMIDADHFKSYNDVHGHPAGDHMIRILGAAMASALERGGDLGARYGGDEFIALLPQTRPDGAYEVAERIRKSIATTPLDTQGKQISTTVSVGVSSYPDHGEELAVIMNRADQALYDSKRLGRNRTTVSGDPTN